jgi:hypothetical protein
MRCGIAILFLLVLATTTEAQKADDPDPDTQATVSPKSSRNVRTTIETGCKTVNQISNDFDQLFVGEVDPVSLAMRDTALPARNSAGSLREDIDEDRTWSVLIGCANQTHNQFQQAEALRIAATWEHLRAEALKNKYRAIQPIKSPRCGDLTQVSARVELAAKNREDVSPDDLGAVTADLLSCAEDSERLNSSERQSEALIARARMFEWMQLAYNNLLAKLRLETENQRRETPKQSSVGPGEELFRERLANSATLITINANSNVGREKLRQVAAHNRALCDQVVTVTRMTGSGLALELGTPRGRKLLAEKYPRTCVLEDTSGVAPGVPQYLLVYASSENAFVGFQPTLQTASSIASGSGTATSPYGNTWNFTYTGSTQTTQTVEAPYVTHSKSLFLCAYDDSGNLVSSHSMTFSTQSGGDPGFAAGYNIGALISLIWNNPKRLAESVLKDVQKDSMKYRSGPTNETSR